MYEFRRNRLAMQEKNMPILISKADWNGSTEVTMRLHQNYRMHQRYQNPRNL